MNRCKYFSDIRVVHFKGWLGGDGLALRRYRLGDTMRLLHLFRSELYQGDHFGDLPPTGCLLFFWLWLHRTFQWFYTIIDLKDDSRRITGFIGLYGIENTQCLKLSIALFSPRDRRRGYGRKALDLLLGDFRKRAVVNAVRVEVSGRNSGSIAFFRNLGFQKVESVKSIHAL